MISIDIEVARVNLPMNNIQIVEKPDDEKHLSEKFPDFLTIDTKESEKKDKTKHTSSEK
jgi:hypothetical protein